MGVKLKQHKVALDQLTKILYRDHIDDEELTGPSFLHSKPLS